MQPANPCYLACAEALECPLKGFLPVNPVVSSYGHVFDEAEITNYILFQSQEGAPRCPLTRRPLTLAHLRPFPEARELIQRVAAERGWVVRDEN